MELTDLEIEIVKILLFIWQFMGMNKLSKNWQKLLMLAWIFFFEFEISQEHKKREII